MGITLAFVSPPFPRRARMNERARSKAINLLRRRDPEAIVCIHDCVAPRFSPVSMEPWAT